MAMAKALARRLRSGRDQAQFASPAGRALHGAGPAPGAVDARAAAGEVSLGSLGGEHCPGPGSPRLSGALDRELFELPERTRSGPDAYTSGGRGPR